MTAYSKAAKRRAKKARMAGFDLPPIVSSKPKARGSKRQREIEREAQAETLAVRARKAGLPNTEAGRSIAKQPWFECDAGRALFLAHRDNERQVRKLWNIVTDWRKCEARFLGNVMSARMYPGRDSVPYLPEPMETRDDTDYDLRDEEEKARAAKTAWQAFCADIEILTEQELRIAFRGVWDREPQFIHRSPGRPPRLTYEGAVFVTAIEKIAEHVGQ